MNKQTRIEVVKAMETLARCVNDEYIFEEWLINGVADGDIDDDTTEEDFDFYIEDEEFAELMGTFLHVMKRAHSNGGLYVDRVVSK
jgi:hypothetical protein